MSTNLIPHLVICGFYQAGTKLLYDLISKAYEECDVGFSEKPAIQSSGIEAARIVSHCPADMYSMGKSQKHLNSARELHFLILIRDFRELLVVRPTWLCGLCLYGFDSSFRRNENNTFTYSDPGIIFTCDVINSAARKGIATIIRYEDLISNPESIEKLVQSKLNCIRGRRFSTPNIKASDTSVGHLSIETGGPKKANDVDRVVRSFRLAPGLFKLLEQYSYEKDRNWFQEWSINSPAAFDDSPGTIVAYYTSDSRYEAEAKRLQASLRRLKLPVEILAIPAKGDWLTHVRCKPAILKEFRRRLRGPLLYVDVDAVVHSDPWPYLRGYTSDVAVASHHGKDVISGTVLLNDSEGALRFLDAWSDEQERNPLAWDQHCLHNVVARNIDSPFVPPIGVDHLPQEMCRVFDRPYHARVGNVIEHLQASREMRVSDGTERSRDGLARRQARILQIANEMQLSDCNTSIDAQLPINTSPAPSRQPAPPNPTATADTIDFADFPALDRHSLTKALIAEGTSDVGRWMRPQNLLSAWSSRAELVGKLIGEAQTVLDLGCGMMDLEKWLINPVRYLPSDLVARDTRTLVCDLNKGELPSVEASVVTLLGVIEYIHAPQTVITLIATRWKRLILTYNPADLDRGRDRRSHGWVNDLSSAQIVAMARDAGFELDILLRFDDRQNIYEFSLLK